MDVRGASGVGYRPDGPKPVTAERIGERMTVSLEAGVYRSAAPLCGVAITTIGVALPDLDPHPGNGSSGAVQHPSRELGDSPLGPADCAAYPGKISIVVQRQDWRIERSGCLYRGLGQQGLRERRRARQPTGQRSASEPTANQR